MSLLPKICLGMALLASLSFSAPGCAPAEIRVTAVATPPRLVWIAPGIWVVEDYPYAIYYGDGAYWMYRDAIWYRSRDYDGGFVRVSFGTVPAHVVHVHRPGAYVRYRAPQGARVRVIDRRSRDSRTSPDDRHRD